MYVGLAQKRTAEDSECSILLLVKVITYLIHTRKLNFGAIFHPNLSQSELSLKIAPSLFINTPIQDGPFRGCS